MTQKQQKQEYHGICTCELVDDEKKKVFLKGGTMSNGKTLYKLKKFCKENYEKMDLIMRTLELAEFDDRVIDYVSEGLWSKKKKLIGKTFSS